MSVSILRKENEDFFKVTKLCKIKRNIHSGKSIKLSYDNPGHNMLNNL